MIWTDLVRRRNDTSLKLDDILLMLVFVYNSIDVRDAFPQEEEERLRSVLGARRRLRNTLAYVYSTVVLHEARDSEQGVMLIGSVR